MIQSLRRKLTKNYETYNRIEVSRAAILRNLQLYNELTGQAVAPVLKSNAYGHGIEIVASALEGKTLPFVAVDGYFEALKVREAANLPVLVMGMIKPDNYRVLKTKDLSFAVHELETIRAMASAGRNFDVHLEINTGMNRHGVKLGNLPDFLKALKSYRTVKLVGVMGHLADADGSGVSTVVDASNIFDKAVETVMGEGFEPRWIHLGQSAGSIRVKSKYANSIRVGIGFYGVNPFSSGHPNHSDLVSLKPALKLVSEVTKIIELKKDDKVSYNYTFAASKPMKIGILPLGYYEGVDRALSNQGVVKIGAQYAKILGRVNMNHTIIDLTDVDGRVGTKVTVISDSTADRNSVEGLYREHRLFTYSTLTSLSPDIRRVLLDYC